MAVSFTHRSSPQPDATGYRRSPRPHGLAAPRRLRHARAIELLLLCCCLVPAEPAATQGLIPGQNPIVDPDVQVDPDLVRPLPNADTSPLIVPTHSGDIPRHTVAGSLGMDAGSWMDSLSLELPPAPNGTVPRVTVISNHQIRDGFLGPGHRLSVGSVISRHSLKGGVPNLTDDDLYRLDGIDLVRTNEGYRAETWTGALLNYQSNSNTWHLEQDGWLHVYGSDPQFATGDNATKLLFQDRGRSIKDGVKTYLDDPNLHPSFASCQRDNSVCNTVAWHLSKSVDPFGNEIVYDYEVAALPADLPGDGYWFKTSRRHRPSRIHYGDAEVRFFYAPRPDVQLDGSSGTPTLHAQRLTAVDSLINGEFYSRYAFSYRDQDLTDCDGEAVAADELPRTLLRRIQRTNEAITAGSQFIYTQVRDLRCYSRFSGQDSWGVEQPVDIGLEYANPSGEWDFERDRVIPLTLNMNGDGRPDLLLISTSCVPDGECHVNHRAAIAGADGSLDVTDGAALWAEEIGKRLNARFFEEARGYAVADLDRDGWAELIWEKPSGSVAMLRYEPYAGVFSEAALNIEPKHLGDGLFADINGDGFLDLLRPHDQVYQLNLGFDPWFSASPTWRALVLPRAGAVPPQHLSQDWKNSNWRFEVDQMRFADFNGDGLVDMAVAMFEEWEDHPACPDGALICRSVPRVESVHSQLYFGDGYGYFIDSGLAAGAPLLAEVPGTPETRNRSWRGTLQTFDLDRAGSAALIGSHSPGAGAMSLWGGHFRGLHDGFGLQPQTVMLEIRNDAGDLLEVREATLQVPSDLDMQVPYSGSGDDCFAKAVYPLWADFDGDGFVDRLKVSVDPEAGLCDGGPCVSLALSQRGTARGRVTAMRGGWGGVTSLRWGFSANGRHDNHHLPVNMEVIQEVVGADGRIVLRYGNGAYAAGEFRGFGLVERRNARGSVDAFAFNLTPALAKKPLYNAHYRKDGSLAQARVFVYGEETDETGLRVDLEAPWFNPMLRRCDYNVERDPGDATIEAMVRHCHGYGRPVDLVPGAGSILAISGLWRYPPSFTSAAALTPFETALNAWGEVSQPYPSLVLSNFDQSQGSSDDFELGLLAAQTANPDWRWPLPAGAVASPRPDWSIDYLAHMPAAAQGQGFSAYVVDWRHDPLHHRVTERIEHRDITVQGDERHTEYEWESFPALSPHYRLRSWQTVAGPVPGGSLLASWSVTAFAGGFDRPAELQRCGGGGDCRIQAFEWQADGEPRLQRDAVGGVREWSYEGGFCGDRIMSDADGTIVRETLDARCRVTLREVNGGQSTFGYDAFHRLVAFEHAPGGDGVARQGDIYWDDRFEHPEDEEFQEPRMAVRHADGRLSLTFFDGFGRNTRVDHCVDAGPGGTDGVFRYVSCAAGSMRSQWRGYGEDGHPMGVAPHWNPDSETAVIRRSLADGAGNTVMTSSAAPVALQEGMQSWSVTRLFAAPNRRVIRNALGEVRQAAWDTLNHVTDIDHTSPHRYSLDVLGRPIRLEVAGQSGVIYEYDGFGNLAARALVAEANCIDTGSSQVSCRHRLEWAYDAADRLVGSTLADGSSYELERDAAGRLRAVHQLGADGSRLATLQRHQYDFSGEGWPRHRVTDENGFWRQTVRDALGEAVSVSDAYGDDTFLQWVHPGGGLRQRVYTYREGSRTRIATVTLDAHGRVIRVDGADGASTTFDYDGAGRLTDRVDADNAHYHFRYLASGHLAEARLGPWRVGRYRYDLLGRTVEQSDRDGVTHRTGYDDLGRVSWVERGGPGGVRVDLNYEDASSRLDSLQLGPVHEGSGQWLFAYDDWGRLRTRTDPAGGVTRWQYDVAGRRRRWSDPEHYVRERRYDARGRLVYAEAAGPNHQTLQYRAGLDYAYRGVAGVVRKYAQRVASRDAAGLTTTRVLDGKGRPLALLLPDGSRVERVWEGPRQVARLLVGPSGALLRQLDYEHDPSTGRMLRLVGPYDPRAVPDAPPQQIDLDWTPAGRLSAIAAGADRTAYEYGSDDGLVHRELFSGLVKTRLRSGRAGGAPRVDGVRLGPASGAGPQRSSAYDFDPAGRLSRQLVTAGNARLERRWQDLDALGNPLLTGSASAAGTRRDSVLTEWEYDPLGRPVARSLSINGTAHGTTRWDWYANGVQASVRTPGGLPIEYDYGPVFDHALDRVRSGNRIHAEITARDAAGRVTGMRRQRSLLTLAYTDMGRLRERREAPLDQPGRSVKLWRGNYDDLGQLVQQAWRIQRQSHSAEYEYDAAGRLVGERSGSSGRLVRYDLDSAGRRLGRSDVIGAARQDQELTWDDGVVASVNGVALAYDPWKGVTRDHHGNRLQRDASGAVRAIGSGTRRVILYRDASGTPVALEDEAGRLQVSHWGLNTALPPLEVRRGAGGADVYVRGPHLLRRLVVQNQQVDPSAGGYLDRGGQAEAISRNLAALPQGTAFGAGVASTEPFAFQGLESVDGIEGLLLARHRVYSTDTGQFLSLDPIGLAGGVHRTRYALGNPVRFTDALGLDAVCSDPVVLANVPDLYAPDIFEGILEKQGMTGGAYEEPQLLESKSMGCDPMGGVENGLPGEDLGGSLSEFIASWTSHGGALGLFGIGNKRSRGVTYRSYGSTADEDLMYSCDGETCLPDNLEFWRVDVEGQGGDETERRKGPGLLGKAGKLLAGLFGNRRRHDSEREIETPSLDIQEQVALPEVDVARRGSTYAGAISNVRIVSGAAVDPSPAPTAPPVNVATAPPPPAEEPAAEPAQPAGPGPDAAPPGASDWNPVDAVDKAMTIAGLGLTVVEQDILPPDFSAKAEQLMDDLEAPPGAGKFGKAVDWAGKAGLGIGLLNTAREVKEKGWKETFSDKMTIATTIGDAIDVADLVLDVGAGLGTQTLIRGATGSAGIVVSVYTGFAELTFWHAQSMHDQFAADELAMEIAHEMGRPDQWDEIKALLESGVTEITPEMLDSP